MQFAKLEDTYIRDVTYICIAIYIQRYIACMAVPFMWGSLRLTPVITSCVLAYAHNINSKKTSISQIHI